jgi:hypothetical protein
MLGNGFRTKLEFQRLGEKLLDRAVNGGLELPIVFVMVSVNGYVSAVGYSRGSDRTWQGDFLVEGSEPAGVFPVNLCFFDPNGKIFNAKIDDPGARPKRVQ